MLLVPKERPYTRVISKVPCFASETMAVNVCNTEKVMVKMALIREIDKVMSEDQLYLFEPTVNCEQVTPLAGILDQHHSHILVSNCGSKTKRIRVGVLKKIFNN